MPDMQSSISRQLGNNLNVAQLLDQITDTAVQLTNAGCGTLLLFDADGTVRRSATRSLPGGDAAATVAAVQAIVDQVAAEGAATTGRAGDRAILCAPLPVNGRPTGVLYVERAWSGKGFTPAERDVLDTFARQAALTIENARLFRQTDKTLARHVEELSLFQRIDQELNRSLDLNHTLGLALEWAMMLTGADSGSIGLLAEVDELRALRLLVYRGERHSGPQTIPLEHPILAQLLATNASVYTKDVTAAQAIDGTAAASQLAVPIQRDGVPIGLIALESEQREAFTAEDILFVKRFSDRAAVAIENARLYEEIQTAHKAKSEFISIVTHELRIPLTSIRGYSDLLAKGMAGPLNEQQQEFVKVIRRNLNRMTILLRDLSDINRMQSDRMNFEIADFALAEVVNDVVASMKEGIDGRGQSITVEIEPDLPPVCADHTRVSQVLSNLLSNANKYTPAGGAIMIRAGRQEGMAVIAVEDNGIGIHPNDQAQLFSQFFRGEDVSVREQPGWGLGLSIVKMLVERQGGEIGCESEPGKGSSFTFTLPLAVEHET